MSSKEEINIIPLLHITNGYSLVVITKTGEPLVNKNVICKCRPNKKDKKYSKGEHKEYLLKTDGHGCINLDLNDYYISNLKIIFPGDDEYERFTSEYIIFNEDLKKHSINNPNFNNNNNLKKAKRKNLKPSLTRPKMKKPIKSLGEKSDKKVTKSKDKLTKKEKLHRRKSVRAKQKKAWVKKSKIYKENEPESIAIELKNISISFKVTNDKIDNIKEYVIRTIKRNKGETNIFKALDDVSLKIHKGEKVGLIGFNGAGKSTLLKIISRVYDADEGEVEVHGNIAPLLGLGAGFDKNYSGHENIFLNGAILGYNKEFLDDKYDDILEFSGLDEFINLPIKNYSAGMKAKLGFSIATLVNPDILIIDEVLGVGDITFRKKSREKIAELMEYGTTVLLVSHSIREIRKICDTAIWIDNGKVRDYGEVNEVCDKYVRKAKKVSKELTKHQKLR